MPAGQLAARHAALPVVIRREDEDALTHAIVQLAAATYGRYGYRRITALLEKRAGWRVAQGSRGAYLASRGASGSYRNRSHGAGCGSTMDRACG